MREFSDATMAKRGSALHVLQARVRHRTGVTKAATTTLLLCSAFFTGCASVGPEQPGEEKSEQVGDLITVKESASMGSGVRSDFEAAMAFLRAEEYEKGIEVLESVVERAPEAIAPHVNLGIAYSRLDKRELAEESFQKALEFNPTHPVANNQYGILLRKTGRFSEAKGIYENVLEAYPDFQPARKNLGILCDLYMNDLGCALENYEAYAEAVPGDESVELWIVDLQRRVGG